MDRYLVAGLGNPGRKYEKTRHNAGFDVIDRLSSELNISPRMFSKKFEGLVCETFYSGKKLFLLKPLTYMNNSGLSVALAADYYEIKPSRIIVVVDDINLNCGRLRIRQGGSAGGHNGLKSIIEALKTQEFPRVRIGVGDKKDGTDLISHVLGKFEKKDEIIMNQVYKTGSDAVLYIMDNSIEEAMNRFNGTEVGVETEKER